MNKNLYELISQNKKIGFASVVGDFVHMGHVNYLEQSKAKCDYLIVGLICSDPHIERPEKNTPIQSIFERYIQLSRLECVDEVIPLEGEEDLELSFKTLPIDIRFVGKEYEFRDFTAKKYCEKNNIKIIYCEMKHGISSSQIRKRVYEAECNKQENIKIRSYYENSNRKNRSKNNI